jgi:3-hydroxy-3-methylglutaryl CoA synthase
MKGIVAYGAYIPYFRLNRKAMAAALGQPAGKGTRAVAAYDEDTTSMGVEAARAALRAAPRARPAALYFATAAELVRGDARPAIIRPLAREGAARRR